MAEQLSSADTVFFKRVFPPLLSVGGAAATAAALLNPHGFFGDGRLAAVISVGLCALSWWWSARLAYVQLDGETLVVTKGSQTIRVAVTEISDVHQNILLNIRPVTIRFKEPTALGRAIAFVPPLKFGLAGPSDLVRRLRLMSKGMAPV